MLNRWLSKLVGISATRSVDFRRLVREREELAKQALGGSPTRPIEVTTVSVIEVRAGQMPCPQCDGELRVKAHEAPAPKLRRVDVCCRQCCVSRSLWFRIVDRAN
jgi:hypothetical protein